MLDNAKINDFISDAFEDSLYAKRIASLANAVQGAIHSCSLAIHAIGSGLAQANGTNRKYAIKQVDRLLSNKKIDVQELLGYWVNFIITDKKEIVVSMDWTDFDSDNQCTIVLSQQTNHGRNTPLLWKTYKKTELKGHRSEYEDKILEKLHSSLPEGVKVTIVADRGFSDCAKYELIDDKLGFDYIIRIKSNTYVSSENSEPCKIIDITSPGVRAKTLNNMYVTSQKKHVNKIVCVKKKDMKEAWYIASSRSDLNASKIIHLYSKRWGIESSFRDIKDYKFGMGMSHMHTSSPERRDKLFLISALAISLLTLLGKAGDEVGLERTLKANTSKERTYSYWRQGCLYYLLLPKMRDEWAIPLMEKFEYYVNQFPFYKRVFSIL